MGILPGNLASPQSNQGRFKALGWRFVIITSTAMFREPLQVLTRIGDATQLRTGQPVVIHDGWRRHFG
jgi:hypothetical protein